MYIGQTKGGYKQSNLLITQRVNPKLLFKNYYMKEILNWSVVVIAGLFIGGLMFVCI